MSKPGYVCMPVRPMLCMSECIYECRQTRMRVALGFFLCLCMCAEACIRSPSDKVGAGADGAAQEFDGSRLRQSNC